MQHVIKMLDGHVIFYEDVTEQGDELQTLVLKEMFEVKPWDLGFYYTQNWN